MEGIAAIESDLTIGGEGQKISAAEVSSVPCARSGWQEHLPSCFQSGGPNDRKCKSALAEPFWGECQWK